MMNTLKSLIKNGLLVSKSEDDSGGLFARFSFLGQTPKARLITSYGFFNKPKDGVNAVLFSLLGNASNQVAFPLMPKGETSVLNDDEFGFKIPGKTVWLIFRNNETIEVKVNNTTFVITDGTVDITNATINVTNGDVIADGISLKNHVHGGVESGGSTTGAPE